MRPLKIFQTEQVENSQMAFCVFVAETLKLDLTIFFGKLLLLLLFSQNLASIQFYFFWQSF